MKFKEPRNEHLQILKDVFKIQGFKHEQWSVIRSIMYDKRDCCIVASTGFGKSLIYQYPPVFMKKLTVVISPLISLMEDQVLSLKSKGIKSCLFGSAQPDKTLKMGDHRIVYITPEFFDKHQAELQQVRRRISMFAVDEAHVIDQWSDFRKKMLILKEIRENFPEVPIVALTATATEDVKKTIVETLNLKEDYVYIRTYLDRPNLEFSIKERINVRNGFMIDLYPLLKNLKEGSAIVYIISRENTKNMSNALNAAGLKTRYYHSKIDEEDKKAIVEDFKANRLRFVICTIAFGMGIDKGDVRLVIHYGLPKSLEAYYQEAGRAGRDGKPSKCIMLYDDEDFDVIRGFIKNNKVKDEEKKKYLYSLVNKVADFVTSRNCRRLEILTYLGTSEEEMKKITIRSDCCDNCKRDLMKVDRIPKTLLFRGLDSEGCFDFSEPVRVLLAAVDGRLIRREIVDMLMGVMPTKDNFKGCKLEIFRKNLGKSREFWENLVSMLIFKKFINFKENSVKLEKDGRRFLRYKTIELVIQPPPVMLECWDRRDDIELFWKDGKVESRPKIIVEKVVEVNLPERAVSMDSCCSFSYEVEKLIQGKAPELCELRSFEPQTSTEKTREAFEGNLQAH